MMLRILLLVVAVTVRSTDAAPSGGMTQNGAPLDALLGCKDNPADIYFLLDCSSSIWIVDYNKQLQFVVDLVKQFSIDVNATRVGLAVFSNDFHPHIELGHYRNKEDLTRAILAAPYLTGNSYTGRAIQGMRTRGFRNARQNVTKIGVVVTDGKSQNRATTMNEARLAKEEGIWIFTIGVGNSVDQNELAAIASEPTSEFRFLVPSYDILGTLAGTLAISTCSLNVQADSAVCGQTNKADIFFAYNAAAMSAKNVDKIKDFLRYAVGEFSMTSTSAPGNVRAGVISQGCNGGDIQLSQYVRREDMLTGVNGLLRVPSYSGLLKRVRNSYRRDARQDALKMAVLFVDDVISTAGDDANYEALLLKYDDVLIHVVALGKEYNLEEVKRLATSPVYVTEFPDYNDLRDVQKQKQFLEKFCEHL